MHPVRRRRQWLLASLAAVWGIALTAGCGRRTPIAGHDAAAPDIDAPVAEAGPPLPDAALPSTDADVPAADAEVMPLPEAGLESPLRVPYRAQSVAVGRHHTCALLDDGHIKCWGYGEFGQLGLGDARDRGRDASEMGDALPTVELGTGRTALQIDAGAYATCAVLDDHSVKCWGLALTLVDVASPARYVGDVPSEMGDGLPVMDLGPGRTANSVAVGDNAACALRDDGSLRCWGRGFAAPSDLPPPAGKRVVAMTGTAVVGVLFDDGSVSDVQYGNGTTPALTFNRLDLGAGRGAKALATNGRGGGLCAVLVGGGVACPPLIAGPRPPLDTAELLGYARTEEPLACGQFLDGEVACISHIQGNEAWGESSGATDPLVHVRLGMPALELVGGGFLHQCARLMDHSVRCWADLGGYQPWLGASFPDAGDASAGAAARWLPIDLGTHPAP